MRRSPPPSHPAAWLLWLALASCGATPGTAEPIPVRLELAHGHYLLTRGGQPYVIRGAGGKDNLAGLAAIGANSVRTWGKVTREFLDEAHSHGLSVCVGLWIEHERHGFDYGNAAAVRAQVERHQAQIDQLKDHPAVLLWGIGNEVEVGYTDPRVWDAVEAVAAHAKAVDPHHPTMTVTAHPDPAALRELKRRAPSVDILGINSYGGLTVIPAAVREHWHGPYVIAEWGVNGRWEVSKTTWGAELEPTSTDKAAMRGQRHAIFSADRTHNLGGYAFLWGHKIEGTLTWFNLFTADGAATEEVEVLAHIWGRTAPYGRAPRVGPLTLNGRRADESLTVAPGEPLHAAYTLFSSGARVSTVRWSLHRESDDKRHGGDAERGPERVDVPLTQPAVDRAELTAPTEPGPYRLYLYCYGAGGKTVATANFPFLVEAPAPVRP